MKRITFIMTLLAGTLQLHAQSRVKGILQDSLTHEGEPYATVRIFSGREVKEQSVPVATALTNLDGLFTATISTRGSFVAVLSSTGKNTVMRPFNADGEKEIDLGVILTSDKESVMNAMEVVAAKPIVKMEPDKVSYSVADDVESRTLTVLDMLRKVPMVSVDGQDNISVNGQASFKVYVNGKPNMMLSQNTSQILKAMPATMVSSIEVITSPGAKYDAEGTGGILNLNMAQAAAQGSGETLNGYNGSLHADGGNLNQGMGGAVSGQRGKFSYSANLELAHVKNNGINMDMTRTQQDGTQTHYLLKTENHVPFVMGNIGLGYELTPLSQMNASFGIMGLKTTNKGFPTTSMSGGGMPAPFEYSNRMKNRFGQTQYNASLDFQHFLDKDRTGRRQYLPHQLCQRPLQRRQGEHAGTHRAGGRGEQGGQSQHPELWCEVCLPTWHQRHGLLHHDGRKQGVRCAGQHRLRAPQPDRGGLRGERQPLGEMDGQGRNALRAHLAGHTLP